MFESHQKRTELIIVCDDKTAGYAKYLVQLISKNDDEENAPVGTKDGTVSAAIFTEKQYRDSLAKITSNTRILFIGKNKTTQDEARFINLKIDRFGMKYGWLGKRAVMYVDEDIKKEEYSEFAEYTEKYQVEYRKDENKAKDIAANVAAWLLAPGIAHAIYGKMKAREEMREQQYRCLTLAIYMDGLQTFLEE